MGCSTDWLKVALLRAACYNKNGKPDIDIRMANKQMRKLTKDAIVRVVPCNKSLLYFKDHLGVIFRGKVYELNFSEDLEQLTIKNYELPAD